MQRVEAGELTLRGPDTVVADAVFVLCSPRTYNLPRADVRMALVPLLRLPQFKIQHRRALIRALDIFVAYPRFDFGDAMILATMERQGDTELYSYDRDFDVIAAVRRIEP